MHATKRPPTCSRWVAIRVGAAVLAIGAAACSLDRSGETSSDGDAASSSSTGADAPTSSAAGPASSSAEAVASASSASSASSGGGSGGSGGAGPSSSSAGSGGAAESSSSAGGSGAGGAGGAEPVCGDGELGGEEQCDDGDVVPGDGCGATCLDENPDDCPGAPIPLDPGQLDIEDSTVGANDTLQDTQGVGPCSSSWPGADLIYAVRPSASGTLRAELLAEYDNHFLVIRTTCDPDADDDILACDFDGSRNAADRVEAPVEEDETYFVVVDAWAAQQAGAFLLRLQLVP